MASLLLPLYEDAAGVGGRGGVVDTPLYDFTDSVADRVGLDREEVDGNAMPPWTPLATASSEAYSHKKKKQYNIMEKANRRLLKLKS